MKFKTTSRIPVEIPKFTSYTQVNEENNSISLFVPRRIVPVVSNEKPILFDREKLLSFTFIILRLFMLTHSFGINLFLIKKIVSDEQAH